MRERKCNKVLNYIILAVIVFAWCVVIFMAGQIDVAYQAHKTKGWAARIANWMVNWGHNKEITVDFLYNTLGGYSSVLLTVVGMIVTGWINISNRLEQKIYGFRRKELFPCAQIVTNLFAGTFVTPVWMVHALFHKYCFRAYFIMGMIFVQFLISNALLAATYSDDHDYIRLNKKIKQSLDKVRNMKGFSQYDALLDRIAASINKDTNWKELYEIFFDVLTGLKETEEQLKIYKVSYAFVSKVFAARRKHLLELIILYTRKMNRENLTDDKAKRVYWVLLDCLYQNCTEGQINNYLEYLYDEMVLDRNLNHTESYLNMHDMDDIFSMVALQTECWLQENDSRLEQFGEKLNRIFRLGSRQYISTGQSLLLDLMHERDEVMKGYSNIMYQCFERLKKSYSAQGDQIHMGSLIESVAKFL